MQSWQTDYRRQGARLPCVNNNMKKIFSIILAAIAGIFGTAAKPSQIKPTGQTEVYIPEEEYAVVSFAMDGEPRVGVFNKNIMQLEPKEAFGWFISLLSDFNIGAQMPDENEMAKMADFCDGLTDRLIMDPNHQNVCFLGRVTGAGQTRMMWYANNPELAHNLLQKIIEKKDYPFDFKYEIFHDPEWEYARYWLSPLNGES